jgi:hypothetical protein
VLGPAADQARRLDHGWVGPEHYLLALLAAPSAATEALAELGITYDRLVDDLASLAVGPEWPRYDGKGLSPNAAGYKLEARAEGLALAFGHRWPAPEHWLLAMVYDDSCWVIGRLHHLGATQPAIVDALRRRGVRVPEGSRPCTGRGAAVTTSRSTRRNSSPCSTCSSGSTHQGRGGAGASTGCRASHVARGWTPRRASIWTRPWPRHDGGRAPEPLILAGSGVVPWPRSSAIKACGRTSWVPAAHVGQC